MEEDRKPKSFVELLAESYYKNHPIFRDSVLEKLMEKPIHVRVAEALGCKPEGEAGMRVSSLDGWTCPCRDRMGYPIHGCGPDVADRKLARYDTDWSATGPLIEKYQFDVRATPWRDGTKEWETVAWLPIRHEPTETVGASGSTPLLAVCHLILALAKAGKL